ncbi:NAD(P)/FAD-dependent oxidoreductase [Mycobacterium sp. 852002-40037_SCH5390672]|uniref:NAD(P)/FAD-dependent oxidoreductase n=1 Tax=Mycobacterium sp. 852002-40037_SCH5390672 TaxID=1834089 RepID=UPI0008055904|nr:geranylgeranyl reductase family protein [Mycobacterium sp. 852002-40037_SCH5390672]OBB89974.1 hypothetical protein A5782_17105 [Mycobacterium sp. 852002-40037_SCH5390672]
MTPQYSDVLVVGGGPAGATAAWRAAALGASVCCLDKAQFPRDKPCGDGLTPHAIQLISTMGLEDDLKKFHRVDRIKIVTKAAWDVRWPERVEKPNYGYVARRLDLDEMLLQCAASTGVRVEQNTEFVSPITEGNQVVGVIARHGDKEQEYRAKVVIGADGAHSRVKRSLGIASDSGLVVIAIRAEMSTEAKESTTLEAHLLEYYGDHIPGYGWVFPMGGGRVNIGVGYLTNYRGSRGINARELFDKFKCQLPADWKLPDTEQLLRSKALQAWRLPMAFTTRPPWRPGLLLAGDAAGVAKPASGAGISRSIASGMLAAEVAVDALDTTGPTDLSRYDKVLRQRWGRSYGFFREVLRLGGNPRMIGLGLRTCDNAFMRQVLLRGCYGRAGATMDYRDV